MTETRVQQTLGGDVADADALQNRRPQTMLWCETCEEFVLRRYQRSHPHELSELTDSDDGDEDESDPEKVGAFYTVTLSYSVDYRFTVPAWSEHEAKERAEELSLDAHPADSYLVHTETNEGETIMSDDPELPEDYDPYGGTMLWDAYGDFE